MLETPKEIAEAVGVRISIVYYALRKYEAELRTVPAADAAPRPPAQPTETAKAPTARELEIGELVRGGMKHGQVATLYNVSRQRISQIAAKLGIPARRGRPRKVVA